MKKFTIGLFLLALTTAAWSANSLTKHATQATVNIEQQNLGPVVPGSADDY